jgi:hypothetical protein
MRKIFRQPEMIELVFYEALKNKSDTHKIISHHGVFKNIGDRKCIG